MGATTGGWEKAKAYPYSYHWQDSVVTAKGLDSGYSSITALTGRFNSPPFGHHDALC